MDPLQRTSTFFMVNGIRMHVVEQGPENGPVLLLLHGFPEFWYGWRKQIAFFAGQGYRVVVPDQRGFNLSSKPQDVKFFQLRELTKDVVALIAALNVKKVYLAGHDWGAMVVWNMLRCYPELLVKAVIINVPHPETIWPIIKRRPDQLLRSWYILFLQLPWLPEHLLQRKHFFLLKQVLLRSSSSGTFSPEDLDLYAQSWSQEGSLPAMLNWYRALWYQDKATQTELDIFIHTPVLIIWGKKDAFLVPNLASASLNKCKQGHLVFFNDATHWVHLEKSEEVNRSIEVFFREAS
jgi:epoxide hydrolase 4